MSKNSTFEKMTAFGGDKFKIIFGEMRGKHSFDESTPLSYSCPIKTQTVLL